MIKKLKDIVKRHTRSLRAGMLAAIICSLLLGVAVALILRTSIVYWVRSEYNSEERKAERYDSYISDLQIFVVKNELSSDDTGEITEWVRKNRNVYLFLYRDNQLFFDSGVSPGSGNVGTDTPDDESQAAEGSTGGIGVEYPSRDEIIASAEKSGLRKLELADGTLFVKLADFSDYTFYNVANIVSIVGGVAAIVIFLMLYFQRIIFKISRLARDVSAVYEVDMNTPIRYDDKNDELSALSRNVEQMRSSMIESLEKEKQAIEANTELITSMSHDIRTPLTVLLGYLDIMKSSTEDEVMKDYIRASEVTCMRLKALSDDMFGYFLVFGKGDRTVDITDYDAKTLLEQLLTEHVLLLREQGYDVRMEIESGIKDGTRVLTDAPKVMRVIDNLFSNIHKYADPEREISVLASLSHGKLNCSIKNYVLERGAAKESNKIGLKTCERICEALKMDFDYHLSGPRSQRVFIARVGFPIK